MGVATPAEVALCDGDCELVVVWRFIEGVVAVRETKVDLGTPSLSGGDVAVGDRIVLFAGGLWCLGMFRE